MKQHSKRYDAPSNILPGSENVGVVGEPEPGLSSALITNEELAAVGILYFILGRLYRLLLYLK
jgi:hypothetical protein